MATIFDQYLQPVRSIQDRMADLDAQDVRREQLTGVRQQNQLQALAMRKQAEAEETGRQQQQRFAGYLQQSGGDVNALQKLLSADPMMFDRSQGLAKDLMEREKIGAQTKQAQAAAKKSEVDADKERLAMEFKKAELTLQATSAATDDRSYGQALQWLSSQGVDISNVPQRYDPNYVASQGKLAMTAKERADQEWKAKGYNLDVRKQGETERQNRAQIAVQMRGQNMTDARAKQGIDLQREAARIQVMETPDGVMLIDKGTGLARPAATMNGRPLSGKDSNMTEGQAKALSFGARMQQNRIVLDELESDGTINRGKIKAVAEGAGRVLGLGTDAMGGTLADIAGSATNWTQSAGQQRYETAKRNWIAANLRKESGAVIGTDEYRQAENQYFPQPGDDKATRADKAALRATAEQTMLAEVPKNKRPLVDDKPQPVPKPPAPNPASKPAGGKPSVSNW